MQFTQTRVCDDAPRTSRPRRHPTTTTLADKSTWKGYAAGRKVAWRNYGLVVVLSLVVESPGEDDEEGDDEYEKTRLNVYFAKLLLGTEYRGRGI